MAGNYFTLKICRAIGKHATKPMGTSQSRVFSLSGLMSNDRERTFIAIKPDGVQRKLIGRIIQRFEDKGLQLVGMKHVTASKQLLEQHYSHLRGKPFFDDHISYMGSSPMVAMVWQGRGAISIGRMMLGSTDPNKSAPGTIRGDFCVDVGRNLVHGSDCPEAASAEIQLWFDNRELHAWCPTDSKWIYER